MNVNGVGDFVIDTMGGIALSTGGRGTIVIDPTGAVSLTAIRSVEVQAPLVNLTAGMIKLGALPIDNVPMGNVLLQHLNVLIAQLKAHVHGNGNNGSPTSPPLNLASPAIVSAVALSTTVKVQK